MEYILSLKYIAGIYVNKNEIKYNKRTLVCDCIDFLKKIKEINLQDNTKNVAIAEFSKIGDLEMVKYLHEIGADINNSDLKTDALTFACAYGHVKIFNYLIQNGADTHLKKTYPLTFAIEQGHFEIVKSIDELINKGRFENLYAAVRHNRIEILKYFVEKYKYDKEHFSENIVIAATEGKLDIIKYLRRKGGDICWQWYRPLRMAAKYGHLNVVKYLMDAGYAMFIYTPQNLKYRINDNPIELAAQRGGHLNVIGYFIFDY